MKVIIKEDYKNMDFEKIAGMLENAYWSIGISVDEVKERAANSNFVFGAFVEGNQVGYARVITDKICFAYLLDVYVDEHYRKLGIGKQIIEYILFHPELKKVNKWLLITKNAHKFYNKFGFSPVDRPLDWMELTKQK